MMRCFLFACCLIKNNPKIGQGTRAAHFFKEVNRLKPKILELGNRLFQTATTKSTNWQNKNDVRPFSIIGYCQVVWIIQHIGCRWRLFQRRSDLMEKLSLPKEESFITHREGQKCCKLPLLCFLLVTFSCCGVLD